jgi:Arc/MetJ-type ribon-helix-helix transcriptional regulator
MIRTQVYLTQEQRSGLAALSRAMGKSRSELIREAVDCLLDQARHRRDEVLRRTSGLWKDRKDLPDFDAMRREWDRR